jgi:hypothetical protein
MATIDTNSVILNVIVSGPRPAVKPEEAALHNMKAIFIDPS